MHTPTDSAVCSAGTTVILSGRDKEQPRVMASSSHVTILEIIPTVALQ